MILNKKSESVKDDCAATTPQDSGVSGKTPFLLLLFFGRAKKSRFKIQKSLPALNEL